MPARSKSSAAKLPKKLYRVRNSQIHGRGVFAATEIPKGSRIIEYRGERTSWKIASERPDSDPDDPSHTFIFELDDGRVIDAAVRGNAARWINHSCAPNCKSVEDDDSRVYIEANRQHAATDVTTDSLGINESRSRDHDADADVGREVHVGHDGDPLDVRCASEALDRLRHVPLHWRRQPGPDGWE